MFRWISYFFNHLFNSGKGFCIGPPASGKTTLVNFIHNKKLIESHIPTNQATEVGKMLELGGDETFVKNHWERLMNDDKYKYVVYVFSTADYIKNYIIDADNQKTYQKIVYLHLYFLKNINKAKKKIIIVGTHVDKLSNEKEIIQKISKDLNNVIDVTLTKIFFGSFKDIDDAKIIASDVEKTTSNI
ncbi:hypothetical protein [Aliarcobacter butzleri]|uniref:hypothetical protein n=1 Tax=Aliarcobacter butzleri TaxID=28197 RepID=UPI000229571C|nr:hypothetical protein [Aliarcobacter butzleri]BAK70529.1 hypothetical protein ABED_0812 [Aliarcobacter butzleri ED-1]